MSWRIEAPRTIGRWLVPYQFKRPHMAWWDDPEFTKYLFGLVLERVDPVPSRVYPRWLDGVPRPMALTVAAAFHSIKGARVRVRKLFSDEGGDALLAQYKRPQ